MSQGTEVNGWEYFQTTYLIPLQTRFSHKPFKVDFDSEAPNYLIGQKDILNTYSTDMFEKVCKALNEFCQSIYEGRKDQLSRYPYVERTANARLVKKCLCAQLIRVVVNTFDSDSD